MHTTDMISSADFDFVIDGHPATLEDIFPGMKPHDRVGIVVRESGGGIGASALIMAAMAKVYDFYRPKLGNTPGKLRIYPEFYVFHVGQRHMDHYWMDIWPPHKEVEVIDDPEQILEAINDRAITRLLVPDTAPVTAVTLYEAIREDQINPSAATFLQETVSSAEQRILSAVAYSSTGRTRRADVLIRSCLAAEQVVIASINSSESLTTEQREQLCAKRDALMEGGRAAETYRRIPFDEAIRMLTTSTLASGVTRRYIALM
ncbi:hypothetical protein [Paenibacillus sp.]|uniref:hypothetical protein n=1 Tax=Paenibacillus TaxID=44249 RepID=UPI0035682E8B